MEVINSDNSNEYDIYFISSFYEELWNNKISLNLKDNKARIETVFRKIEKINDKKKYIIIIHKVSTQILNQLKLEITCPENLKWDLNKINLQKNQRLIFKNLEINYSCIENFLEHYSLNDSNKIGINLNEEEKLIIYLEYFKYICWEYLKEKNELNKYIKIDLIKEYINMFEREIFQNYSFQIDLFSLSFGTTMIEKFLEKFEKIDLLLNNTIESKIFDYYLNLYKKDKNIFFEIFKKPFIEEGLSKNIEKSMNLLEIFITIYQLFYEDPKKIEPLRLKNAYQTVINIINNKKDIINYFFFVIHKYKSFSIILSQNKKVLEVDDSLIETNFDFGNFQSFYQTIIIEEEKFGVVFNLHKIANYFFNRFLKNNDLVNFSDLIEIFNISFENKNICNFLDNYEKINYNFNELDMNVKFNSILNIYKKDRKKFFGKNIAIIKSLKKKHINNDKNKESEIINKYCNLLENFILMYQLFYEKDSLKIELKTRLIPTFKKIINNKKDLIVYMKFILDKFEKISFLFVNKKGKKEDKIVVEKNLIEYGIEDMIFKDFIKLYELLVKKEEECGFF